MTMVKQFLFTSLLFVTSLAFGQGDTTTTILGLTKPGHLSHVGNWDVVYNTDFDMIDSTYPLTTCVRVAWDGIAHKFYCLPAVVEGDVTNLVPDLALKAPLASPALTGTPTVPTAAPGTNTTQAASTAFVQAAAPVQSVAGKTGAVSLAEGDIASLIADLALKATLASPVFTGTPTVPTAAPGTNTTQAASTAFVQAALPTVPVSSVAGKTGAVTLVEADIASLVSDFALKASLASPALTGVPTAPTATLGTNTTQIASTAFVLANGGAPTGTAGGYLAGTYPNPTLANVILNTTNNINAVGVGALSAFTDTASTDGDIAIGFNALHALATVHDTTGGEIGIGYGALQHANNGVLNSEGNVAIGYQALNAITTSVYNTAVGYQALQNSTVSENTAFGYQAIGTGAASGVDNVAVGYQAMNSLTTGSSNEAIGTQAAAAITTGNDNIAFGYRALKNVTSSGCNIAIGALALNALTSATIGGDTVDNCSASGGYNIALGHGALQVNTTGYAGLAIGTKALAANTTGHGNMAIGYNTLLLNDTGHDNTAIGAEAIEQANGASIWGVALGTDAYFGNPLTPTPFTASNFTALGSYAGQNVQTGADQNIFVGFGSGGNVTTGHDNIVIGSDVGPSSPTAANALDIGNVLYGSGMFSSGTQGAGGATTTTGPNAGGRIGIMVEAPATTLQVAGTGVSTTDGIFGSYQQGAASACETSYGITTLSGASTNTGLSCLPANSVIDAVVYRITTTITTAASFTIGDGTIATRFCGTQSTMTAGVTGVCFAQADQTGTSGPRQLSAAAVKITPNTTPGAGAIRLIVYYHAWVAPTS